jgi:hypothetical protein
VGCQTALFDSWAPTVFEDGGGSTLLRNFFVPICRNTRRHIIGDGVLFAGIRHLVAGSDFVSSSCECCGHVTSARRRLASVRNVVESFSVLCAFVEFRCTGRYFRIAFNIRTCVCVCVCVSRTSMKV